MTKIRFGVQLCLVDIRCTKVATFSYTMYHSVHQYWTTLHAGTSPLDPNYTLLHNDLLACIVSHFALQFCIAIKS